MQFIFYLDEILIKIHIKIYNKIDGDKYDRKNKALVKEDKKY